MRALRGEDSMGVVKPEGAAERSGKDALLIGPLVPVSAHVCVCVCACVCVCVCVCVCE